MLYRYAGIFFAAFLLLSLPLSFAERVRSAAAAFFAPLWKGVQPSSTTLSWQEKAERLVLENKQLKNQIDRLLALVDLEQGIADFAGQLLACETDEKAMQQALERRRKERKKLFSFQLDSLPARIIYRPPTLWHSSLWIDVGEEHNAALGRTVVAEDSPVVVGNSLIGVVDLVNARQSRVRLITDAGLCPSVRAMRGDPQRQLLVQRIDFVASRLANAKNLFCEAQKRSQMLETLLDIREQLVQEEETLCLAKGELRGSGRAFWRKQGNLLRGVGFNYDFADEEGAARALAAKDAPPLVQVGDVLVTTGMDGVFPAGLHVAEVTHVFPLREGDYFYELEAYPTAGDLDHLSLVSILPALSKL